MKIYYDGFEYVLVLDENDDLTTVKAQSLVVHLEGTTNQAILKYGDVDHASGVELYRVNDHTVAFVFNDKAIDSLMNDKASIHHSQKLWVHVDTYNDWYTHRENYGNYSSPKSSEPSPSFA